MIVRHETGGDLQPHHTRGPHSRPIAGVAGLAARLARNEEGRGFLWWPAGLAVGIAVYFNLPREPDWRVAVLAAAAVLALTLWARRHSGFAYITSLALLACTVGFAASSVRTYWVAAPVVLERIGPVEVEGTVIAVDARGSSRLAVRIRPGRIDRLASDQTPAEIRITAARSQAGVLNAGDRVSARAVLMPPPGPVAPGAYDFARRAWFDRLGAVGFAVSNIERTEDARASRKISFALAVERLRARIAGKIAEAVPGQQGTVAAALLTGKRGAIPEDVLLKIRDAGLAHLLAISGLHMVLVCGAVFSAVSLMLALVPWLALRITVGKWAAAAALAAGLGYYLLAGGSVATERAFIMAMISLCAIMIDRPAITIRNVAIAATVTLMLRPESLNQAGFQMSFGAVVALVAFYEYVRAVRGRKNPEHRTPPRPVTIIARTIAAVAATTIIATLATGPIAAYHFNRVAAYGLVANLVAVPLAGFVVMPLGLVSLAAMAVGLEAIPLELMAAAIGYIIDVAARVAAWQGAVRLVPATPGLCLVLFVLGGLWLCLWRSSWRLVGIGPMVMAAQIGAFHSPPDLLIARDGRNIAIRASDGRLSIALPRAEGYSLEQWLRRDGDMRKPAKATPGIFSCDTSACVASAANGLKVAYVMRRDALVEECWASDILVTPLVVKTPCRASLVIDLFDLRRNGPHAVKFAADGSFQLSDSASIRGHRPWAESGFGK